MVGDEFNLFLNDDSKTSLMMTPILSGELLGVESEGLSCVFGSLCLMIQTVALLYRDWTKKKKTMPLLPLKFLLSTLFSWL